MIDLNENVIMEMNEYMEDDSILDLLVRNRKNFHFQVMFTKEQLKQDVEVLDLKPRAYNCLKRYGFNTLNDLVNGVYTKENESSKRQLLRIRNLGRNTAEEILMKLFYYQFQVMPDSRKKWYMQRIVELNN
jgi:DNA-directed RNA polymerase alpha subunit